MQNEFTKRYRLKLPLVQAGMAFIATPPLAAAVSNAGGMGMLGAGVFPPEGVAAMIRATRQLTKGVFGVDFITDFTTPEHIAVCLREKVPVVVFYWSLPKREWVEELQQGGLEVWMQVNGLKEALAAKELGCSVVILQGIEGGGHNKSTASLFAALPAVVDALSPLPVLAAGGIADGRGMVAAFALGAQGVWMGTRFVASTEANASTFYQQAVVAAGAEDTVITRLFGPEWPSQPMRVIKNGVVEQSQQPGFDVNAFTGVTIGQTELGGQTLPLPKFSAILPMAATQGDHQEMALAAGESAGLIRSVEPVARIVQALHQEMERSLEALPGWK